MYSRASNVRSARIGVLLVLIEVADEKMILGGGLPVAASKGLFIVEQTADAARNPLEWHGDGGSIDGQVLINHRTVGRGVSGLDREWAITGERNDSGIARERRR